MSVIQRFIFTTLSSAKIKLSRRNFIFLSAVLVAVTMALAAVLLKLFVHFIFEQVTKTEFSSYQYFYVLLPMIGILLTIWMNKRLFGNKLSKGLAQIHFAIAKRASILPRRSMFDQLLTSSITVGFGGSTGLEAPIVVTGAAIGSNYARTYRLNAKERTLLLACGIAAGIGAAFNAPIAGVLFALEVLLVDISISAFTPLIISGATGALMANIILKQGILLNFELTEVFNYYNVPFYVLLGLLSGLLAVYHSRSFIFQEHLLRRLLSNQLSRGIVAGLLLAGLILVFPPLFGEGYQSIKLLAEGGIYDIISGSIFAKYLTNEWIFLVFVGLIMFVKSAATALTIGGGGNGGNFAPSLFIGAYLGFLISRLVNSLTTINLPVSNFTLVGMAGILSGVYHAPLTAIFLIAEITNGYSLMIPLMIVASISFAVSKSFEPYSMDTKSLAEKGHSLTEDKDSNVLSGIEIRDLLDSDYKALTPNMSIEQALLIIKQASDSLFPVVSENNQLVGLINSEKSRLLFSEKERYHTNKVADLMEPIERTISINQTMKEVIQAFETTASWSIPVLQGTEFIGFIHKPDLFEVYRLQLKESVI